MSGSPSSCMGRRAFALRLALATSALALVATSAHATFFTYPDFSSTAGLTLVGNAGTTTTGDGVVLRLTPATTGQSGAAYSTSPITLGASATFSTQFQFRFSQTGGIDPADGITFVLAKATNGLGSAGGGIGYSGVPNSVAIEFDTYNNGSPDISDNHIAIDTNGVLTNTAAINAYGIGSCGFSHTIGCMSDGNVWTVNISYDGSLLNVTLKDAARALPFVALTNYAIDIGSFLGTNTAFVGFTAATGSGFENHDILNWQFANTAQLPGDNAVPEPASIALLASGLLGLGLIRRRKRKG